ncbi:MAG TPA: ATP-binding protein [Flavipsychrobacter sp.]|nr:ATP-binding protein [Flavipsychrobacter sp.]
MTEVKTPQWQVANQQYLSGYVHLLKKRLETYANGSAEKSTLQQETQKLSTIAENMDSPPAIEMLSSSLKLSLFEKNILLVCAGVELDAGLSEIISTINGNPLHTQPSFAMLLAAFEESHWSATAPASPLRFWRLIEINKSQLITQSPLKIDEQILHFLTGNRDVSEGLVHMIDPIELSVEPTASQKKMLERPLKMLSEKTERYPVLHFFGNNTADKLITASYVAQQLDRKPFVMSANTVPLDGSSSWEWIRLWNREAALHDYLLYLDCSAMDSSDKQRVQAVENTIEKITSPLIFSSDNWTPVLRRNKLTIDIHKPTPSEQKELWQSLLPHSRSAKTSIEKIVSQFSLNLDTIHRIARESKHKEKKKGSSPSNADDALWATCCDFTRPKLDDLAQHIQSVATWHDLVLPETPKNLLWEIVHQVKQRNKVYEDWGFSSKTSRGLGITALFSGESGTGKTMASEVLANELKLDLYKIDLSKVVNKYIGETEKNLKKIFDAAEDGGAILLFDEADALFGKRSDTKDSHDRYANIEVSYLLQRMESYCGLAILTTNLKSSMDKAFLRRIRFVVQFPFPDATQRTEMWRRVFPQDTPKEKLDMDRLSKFTVSGGNIRNIAMNAAFHAATDNAPVQMAHILKAARAEYDKMEKQFNNM